MNEFLAVLHVLIFMVCLGFFAVGVMVTYAIFTEDEKDLIDDLKTFKEMIKE